MSRPRRRRRSRRPAYIEGWVRTGCGSLNSVGALAFNYRALGFWGIFLVAAYRITILLGLHERTISTYNTLKEFVLMVEEWYEYADSLASRYNNGEFDIWVIVMVCVGLVIFCWFLR